MPQPTPPSPARAYILFALWTLPSLLVTGFANIILMPRLEAVSENSDIDPAAASTPLNGIMQFYDFVLNKFWFVVPILVGLVVILEIFVKPVRRWRGFTLGLFAYSIHLVTMIALALLATTALVFVG